MMAASPPCPACGCERTGFRCAACGAFVRRRVVTIQITIDEYVCAPCEDDELGAPFED